MSTATTSIIRSAPFVNFEGETIVNIEVICRLDGQFADRFVCGSEAQAKAVAADWVAKQTLPPVVRVDAPYVIELQTIAAWYAAEAAARLERAAQADRPIVRESCLEHATGYQQLAATFAEFAREKLVA